MKLDVAKPEASLAIQLRLAVRDALDRDDMNAVRVLNRAADDAYAKLSPIAAGVYLAWCRDDMQALILPGGDA